GQRPRRDPGVRRVRVHERVPGRPVLPRRQDPGDRRGHLGGAADADRPPARPGLRGGRGCPAPGWGRYGPADGAARWWPPANDETEGDIVASWDDLGVFVRVRYEIMKSADGELWFNLPTVG